MDKTSDQAALVNGGKPYFKVWAQIERIGCGQDDDYKMVGEPVDLRVLGTESEAVEFLRAMTLIMADNVGDLKKRNIYPFDRLSSPNTACAHCEFPAAHEKTQEDE